MPRSFLSVSEEELANHTFKPGEISFVIEDAGSIIPFKEEVLPQLQETGNTAWFFDGGWPAVEQQLGQAGELSVLKLAAFAAAAVLALWLTVYLFILRKKREFAIMRALGCTKKDAVVTLLMPLVCLGVVAIAIGSAAALVYTVRSAEQNLAEFAALGLTPDTSIPVGIVLAGVLGSLALAVAALLATDGRELAAVSGLLALYLTAHFVFCILTSLSASVSVTRRRVLELLQVKE